MLNRIMVAGLIAVAALGSQGCAAIGLTLFGVGAGVAAGTGTSYTLDGIAYRTFTAPLDDVRRAAHTTLTRMDIALKSDETADGGGRAIVAAAGDRTVHIDLERLTARTTRMRVTVKQGWIWRDRATAGELIAQTEHALDDLPALSQKKG